MPAFLSPCSRPMRSRPERARTLSALASPVVSDFAAAEFSSAVGRKVRTRELSETDARRVFSEFDDWLARVEARPEIRAIDVATATAFLRRLDLNLRAPDALNIAVARRL